jgi:hypothetical protein
MIAKPKLWRCGALAVFGGLPLLLLGVGIANVADMAAAGYAVTRDRTVLSQILAEVAGHRAVTLTKADIASLYLASGSASLARAEIQQAATGLVTAAGGRLVETQLVGTQADETAGIVAVQLTLSIDNPGLLSLLYRIETGLPLLEVAELGVTRVSESNGIAVDERVGLDEAVTSLQVQLIVSGHWRKTS